MGGKGKGTEGWEIGVIRGREGGLGEGGRERREKGRRKEGGRGVGVGIEGRIGQGMEDWGGRTAWSRREGGGREEGEWGG